MDNTQYMTLTESQVKFLKWLITEHEGDLTAYTRSMILNVLDEVNMNGRRVFLGVTRKSRLNELHRKYMNEFNYYRKIKNG